MRRLPLFPIPTVLLPGSVVPLHVFEPRYRRMVARCLEFDRRFGIVYHDPDRHGPFLSEPGRVGTVARIRAFRALADGRSLLLVAGEERFAIHDGLETDEPFYEAVVEEYRDHEETLSEATLETRRRWTLNLYDQALEALGRGDDARHVELGADISFSVADQLVIGTPWLQGFLELRREIARLDQLDAVFEAVREAE